MMIQFLIMIYVAWSVYLIYITISNNKKHEQIKLERQKYEDKKVADSETRKLRGLQISDSRILQLYIMYDEDKRYLFDPYGALNKNGIYARLYVNRHCGFIVMETSDFCRYINSLHSFYAKDKSPAKVFIKEKRISKDRDLEFIKAGKGLPKIEKKEVNGLKSGIRKDLRG